MTKTKLESDCKTRVTLKRLSWLFTLMLMMVGYGGWGQTFGTDFSQGSNNNGNAGQGNIVWIGSIIQQSNSNFYEGQSILQRFFLMNIPVHSSGQYKLQISHQATKGGIHAYDFVTAWPKGIEVSNEIASGTYNDPSGLNVCSNLGSKVTAAQCAAFQSAGFQIADPVPFGDYGTTVSNGDDVASKVQEYDLAYGGATTARGIQVRALLDADNSSIILSDLKLVWAGYTSGSDQYAQYELRFTGPTSGGNFNLLVQLAGHLGLSGDNTGIAYGPTGGSSNINGGPYHFKLGNFIYGTNDKLGLGSPSSMNTSLGSQDNQIKGADIKVQPPPCTITPSTNTICAGGSASFSGPAGMDNYAWTVSGGLSFSGQGTQTITITNAPAGTYTITLVTTKGTVQSVDVCQASLTVNPNAQANAGPNQTLCQTPPSGPTMFTLAGVATNSSSTLWEQTNATGTASANITTPSSLTSGVSVSGIGTVTLQLTAFANGGCASATSTVVLRVNPNPTADAGSSPTPQCLGATGTNTFSLSGSGTNGTPSWSVVSGTAVVSSGANTYTPTVTTTGSGTFVFRLTVTSDQTPSCGTASSTVSVTVYPLPGAPSPQGTDRCGAGMLTFTASCDGTIKWYAAQFGGSPLYTGNTYTPTATEGQTITVWASCTNGNNCEGPRASATATAYGYPTVNATADPTIINLLGPNRKSTLTATGSTATYTWSAVLEFPYSDGSGLLSGTTGAVVTVTVPNAVTAYKYMVTAEGPGGCTSTATVVVETIANFTCPEINGPATLCVGSAGTFTSTAPPQYVTYDWSAEGATVSGTGTSVEITPTVAGVYTVTITMTAESGWPEPVSCTITRTAEDCDKYGCSQGFWKQHGYLWDEMSDWVVGQITAVGGTAFTTKTPFATVFGGTYGIGNFDGSTTMMGALNSNGGGCIALARNAVAALLGKAAFGNQYAYSGTYQQILDEIKSAFASGDCGTLNGLLNTANNMETNCSALKNNSMVTRMNTKVESPLVQHLNVTAAPNPFFDKVRFTISTPVDGNVQLEVVNMLGQKVSSVYNGFMKANTTQVVEYSVPSSAPQNLIYIMRSGNEQVTGKLLRANR